MADYNAHSFNERLKRIESEHHRLSGGYVRLEERNGILVPVKTIRTRRGFPWRGLFLVLVAFLVFKALLLAHMGPIRFVKQHAELEQGNIVEQMTAFAMRPDPATVFLSEKLEPVLGIVLSLTQLTNTNNSGF